MVTAEVARGADGGDRGLGGVDGPRHDGSAPLLVIVFPGIALWLPEALRYRV
ncbi:MAG: hypothetical protein U5L11_02710 [Arhodomonas sp.]|nr:hypothetical protein [Arhodomonas sp.]